MVGQTAPLRKRLPPRYRRRLRGRQRSLAAGFIERLAQLGITVGFGEGTYRPDNPVSRAETAVFIVRAFDLPILP